jgi:hypothetical protein
MQPMPQKNKLILFQEADFCLKKIANFLHPILVLFHI